MDLGFHGEGFRTQLAYDLDSAAVDTFNSNFGLTARIVDLAGRTPLLGRPDILLAGSPCQGFSTAGRRDPSDPRNALVMAAASAALASKARVIVIENVPAALSGAQGMIWRTAEDMLRWYGYQVRRIILSGDDSGVAQRRRRLFMLCWRGSDCIRVEMPQTEKVSLSEALRGVQFLPDHDPVSLPPCGREGIIARHIPQGAKLCNVRISERAVHSWDIPEVFGPTTISERELLVAIVRLRRRARRRDHGDADPVMASTVSEHVGRDARPELSRLVEKGYLRDVPPFIDLTNTYNGKFRRLRWSDPSPTVDTHFGQSTLFLHPDEDRAMTPREAARIQGFPDDFAFAGSRTQRFRLIGNAVPPPMAARVAAFIRSALL